MKVTFETKLKDIVEQFKSGQITEEQLINHMVKTHEHDKANIQQVVTLQKTTIQRLKNKIALN